MLLLLIAVLLLASLFILCIKKSEESIYLLGMCVSLMLQFCGILIFIAKKGGYSKEILDFLYFSNSIKQYIQYLYIVLDLLGYLIALGRYLFPMFLMLMAFHYSMIPIVRKSVFLRMGIFIMPILSLIVYYPVIYKYIVEKWPFLQDIIVEISYYWVLAYVVIAIGLMVQEFFAITMKFCKRQFVLILVCMLALSGLYILYSGQDPGQVYKFYSFSYSWRRGIGYLQYAPSIRGYTILIIVNVICGALGFTGLFRYTQAQVVNDREEVVLERSFGLARVGASVFVHGIKNQLLANRVLYKRIHQLYQEEEVQPDKVKEYVGKLEESNEVLLSRMEELYRSVKTNAIYLKPCTIKEIGEDSVKRFLGKYPNVKLDVDMLQNTIVLADKAHICEAVYNLLSNAYEAVVERGEDKGEVKLKSYNERLYTIIEVEDNGVGISKGRLKKIFGPFYSSKNSNYNWGMGLYYVRAIVKGHYGMIRVESKVDVGSKFYILLPKYKAEN